MPKFPKEILLLEANGHKFPRKPMFPKTISPHSLKSHVFPWQMGPNSPKQTWFLDVPLVPKAIHVPWGTLGPFASSLGKTSSSNSLVPRVLPQPILLLKATWPRKSGQVACPNTNLFSR